MSPKQSPPANRRRRNDGFAIVGLTPDQALIRRPRPQVAAGAPVTYETRWIPRGRAPAHLVAAYEATKAQTIPESDLPPNVIRLHPVARKDGRP